jgi:hypothetical protein
MTGHRHTNPNDTSMPASYAWPRSRWSIKFWDTYVKLLARHNVPRPAPSEQLQSQRGLPVGWP